MRHSIFNTLVSTTFDLTLGETLRAIGVSLILAPPALALLWLFLAL